MHYYRVIHIYLDEDESINDHAHLSPVLALKRTWWISSKNVLAAVHLPGTH